MLSRWMVESTLRSGSQPRLKARGGARVKLANWFSLDSPTTIVKTSSGRFTAVFCSNTINSLDKHAPETSRLAGLGMARRSLIL